jgi:hypothetical protein
MKKLQMPDLNADKVFDFHKSGGDSEFDAAMERMNGMYDSIFAANMDYEKLFENIKVDNNPILDPIDHMMGDIFDPNDVRDGKQYQKVSKSEAQTYK